MLTAEGIRPWFCETKGLEDTCQVGGLLKRDVHWPEQPMIPSFWLLLPVAFISSL